jgi:A/G-specific adenine glycosylase
MMDEQLIEDFLEILNRYYNDSGRHDMLWRQPEPDGSFSPYKILISEIMLQQTQVSRVAPKFLAFTSRFPTVHSLAQATLGEVLQLWSGLGYNRRAKYLLLAAQTVDREYSAIFPDNQVALQRLPGVGPNTAGAIMAYAFNQPVVYVETNIRTVLIHHFFKDETGIGDSAIKEVLDGILQQLASDPGALPPREFYWAMMDYGAYLKKSVGNLNRDSAAYARQSTFYGSRRQVRGQAIRLLTERKYAYDELVKILADERAEGVIDDLVREGMLHKYGQVLSLQE